MLKTDGMCTQCTMYRSIVLFFFNVDINEYTFDIFEKPILQVLQKKSLQMKNKQLLSSYNSKVFADTITKIF